MNEKLTNSTDETSLQGLFNGSNVFQVPYFQRPYKWTPKKIDKLLEDLERITDNGDELHFVGAVIVHGLPGNPAEASFYQVIDGQQRMTSVFLILAAAVEVLAEGGDLDSASSLFRSYLVTLRGTKGLSNSALHPSGQDRASLNKVFKRILNVRGFEDHLGEVKYIPLAEGKSTPSNRIESNFKRILKVIRVHYAEGGVERVERIYSTLLQRMTLVQIDIRDTLSGPKIFDSLNSGQEPMTVGELVKNDIFSRELDADVDQLNEKHWEPFYQKFGDPDRGLFDNYFFPYGLYHRPEVKKADVYPGLQLAWTARSLTPQQIIGELREVQPDYLDLIDGDNRCEQIPSIHQAFKRLRRLGAPSSVLPFLMHLSFESRKENINVELTLEILKGLESFFTRRAVCGIEPTGLHAVFKGLWQELQEEDCVSIEGMQERIALKKTVQWPGDEDFQSAIKSRNLYGSRITQFILAEYDVSHGGDTDPEAGFEIEHVLPKNPKKGEWLAFDSETRARYTDCLANLLPISSEMNKEVSNSQYDIKRPIFESDSRFKSTRQFARHYLQWGPDETEQRACEMADWAIARWQI